MHFYDKELVRRQYKEILAFRIPPIYRQSV